MRFENNIVSVDQVSSRLAVSQIDLLLSAAAHFQQAALGAYFGAGDGAGAQQIAGHQVAAVRRVMRHHLRNGPVQHRCVHKRKTVRFRSVRAHFGGMDEDLEIDIEAAIGLIDSGSAKAVGALVKESAMLPPQAPFDPRSLIPGGTPQAQTAPQ